MRCRAKIFRPMALFYLLRIGGHSMFPAFAQNFNTTHFFSMKHALRFVLIAMIFATAGLFAQAATDDSAPAPQQNQSARVVKKLAKKHKKHKKQKAQ